VRIEHEAVTGGKMLAISIFIDYPEHINADCQLRPPDLLNTLPADFLIGFSPTAYFRGA